MHSGHPQAPRPPSWSTSRSEPQNHRGPHLAALFCLPRCPPLPDPRRPSPHATQPAPPPLPPRCRRCCCRPRLPRLPAPAAQRTTAAAPPSLPPVAVPAPAHGAAQCAHCAPACAAAPACRPLAAPLPAAAAAVGMRPHQHHRRRLPDHPRPAPTPHHPAEHAPRPHCSSPLPAVQRCCCVAPRQSPAPPAGCLLCCSLPALLLLSCKNSFLRCSPPALLLPLSCKHSLPPAAPARPPGASAARAAPPPRRTCAPRRSAAQPACRAQGRWQHGQSACCAARCVVASSTGMSGPPHPAPQGGGICCAAPLACATASGLQGDSCGPAAGCSRVRCRCWRPADPPPETTLRAARASCCCIALLAGALAVPAEGHEHLLPAEALLPCAGPRGRLHRRQLLSPAGKATANLLQRRPAQPSSLPRPRPSLGRSCY